MPLGIPSGQYLGFLAYFNQVSVNGIVGRNELMAILERAGRDPTDMEVQKIIDSVSTDGRGICFHGFINYVRTFQQLRNVDSEYREAFRIYDRTGAGKLTQEDITYVFKKLGVTVDVPALFKIADADGNGTIEYGGRGICFQGFINYVRTFQQLRNVDSEYREAFRIYDRTGAGKLTQEDITYVFKKLGVTVDVPALFKIADADGNGTIEYGEFVELMNKTF